MLCRNSAHAWYRKLSRGFVQPFRCLNFIQVFWWSLYSGGYWNIFQNKKEIQGLSHSIVMSPIPLYYLSHSAGNTFLTKVFDFCQNFYTKNIKENVFDFLSQMFTPKTQRSKCFTMWLNNILVFGRERRCAGIAHKAILQHIHLSTSSTLQRS